MTALRIPRLLAAGVKDDNLPASFERRFAADARAWILGWLGPARRLGSTLS